ncbi:MAG TPA: hydroxymethylbilane synthase [Solirubrobacteraceae bacterium]|nr:hydroxymethylbilane synthase [Solirubrobacteraceae bacterium]
MRIGTRGSALALAQARWVAERVPGGAELVPIVTSGDRRRAVDDKREWVLELEEALLGGEVDLAVHSAKDVPVERPEGLAIAAAPPRANPLDALCGAPSLDALPEGARVGTSSLRRMAQLRARRPDLDVVALRGNVDTRLRKLADGEAAAIVLAAAGLERLGRADAAQATLDFVPAAGQGTLLIEARADDGAAREALAPLSDPAAEAALAAERAVVAGLGADCRSAVGVHAAGGAAGWRLRAFVGAPDGSAWITDELDGDDPAPLAAELAERLLAVGAERLLRP